MTDCTRLMNPEPENDEIPGPPDEKYQCLSLTL